MITLGYTTETMIKCLQKIGYEVKKEKVNEYVGYNGQEQEVERSVYNCYYKGERIDLWDYLYGTRRLEMVFEQEVRNKIERLF
jgi:hypothetical protein